MCSDGHPGAEHSQVFVEFWTLPGDLFNLSWIPHGEAVRFLMEISLILLGDVFNPTQRAV